MNQNFALYRADQTNAASATGQVQVIIPSGTFSACESQVLVEYTAPAVANTLNTVYRSDFCWAFNAAANMQYDGEQRCQWTGSLAVAQKLWYDRYIAQSDTTNGTNAGGYAIQKWKIVTTKEQLTANSTKVQVYYPLKMFLAGAFGDDEEQRNFLVRNQITVTLNIGSTLAGCLAYQDPANGPNSVLTLLTPTTVKVSFLLKLLPEGGPVPDFVRSYYQFSYLNTQSINATFGIGPAICDKQDIAITPPSGITVENIDNYQQAAVTSTAVTITKQGYSIVAAKSISEAIAMLSLSRDSFAPSFNNLFAIFEQPFTNLSLNHQITLNTAAGNVYIGYHQIHRPLDMQMK